MRILAWIVAHAEAGPNGLGGHARPAVWDLDPGLELREPRGPAVSSPAAAPGKGRIALATCPVFTSSPGRVGQKGGSSIGGFGMLLYYNNIWKAPATARVRVASDAPICVWYPFGIRIRYSI